MLDAQNTLDAVQEPATSDYSGRGKYKQVARIIKHLRRELQDRHPHLAQPTGWMIDCLVYNCPLSQCKSTTASSGEKPSDWQAMVMSALTFIARQTDGSLTTSGTFTQLDGSTPLFPNHELFDEVDAHHFCTSLLEYMRQELHC